MARTEWLVLTYFYLDAQSASMSDRRAGTTKRVGAIAAVATAVLVTVVGLGALATGNDAGWLVLAVGWGVCVPLASGTGVLVASTLGAAFDAVLAVASSRGGRADIAVADLGRDDGDPDRSRAREPDLGRSGRS